MSNEAEKVCVTGGSGCIGSWLVRLLLERGYAVHATVQNLSYYLPSSPYNYSYSFQCSSRGIVDRRFKPYSLLLSSSAYPMNLSDE